MTNKLTEGTRKEIEDIISNERSLSFHDYTTRDFRELVCSGLRGLDEWTDLELVDELMDFVKDCVCGEPGDPMLNSMYMLLANFAGDNVKKEEIKHYINVRKTEISTPPPAPTRCESCKECQKYIDLAKMELGL